MNFLFLWIFLDFFVNFSEFLMHFLGFSGIKNQLFQFKSIFNIIDSMKVTRRNLEHPIDRDQ